MSQNDPAGLAHAKNLIKENLETKDTFLDLGNCGLRDLSELPELWECQHLEGFSLGLIELLGSEENVILSSFPYWGENLIGEEGAKSISTNLTKLKHLYLCGNQIGDNGAILLSKNLLELNSLDLYHNSIGDKGVLAIAENLKYLTYLNLGANEIGDLGAKHISENLKNLLVLSLNDNSIKDDGTINIATNLKKLNTLDLGINGISDKGAISIAKNLNNLFFLDLGANNIGDNGVKHIAAQLKNLTCIKLDHNVIGDESIELIVRNLKKLIIVDFTENNTLKIRYEILNSIEGLRENFGVSYDIDKNIEINLIPNNTTKIILVGNSTAGKTSLAKYLIDEKFDEKHESTHGVKCWVWEPIINGQKYKVNIRDFGGQDYFHATQSIFFDLDSLFILLHTNESVHQDECTEDEQFHSSKFWLGNIEDILLDSKSNDKSKYVVWYIQNKTDHENYYQEWLDQSSIDSSIKVEQQYFISIKSTSLNVSNPPISWRHFLESLKEKIVALSATVITEWWAAIRDEALPQWRKEKLVLTRDEFSFKCKDFLTLHNIPYITSNESFAGVLDYLKNSGEVVWFKEKQGLNNYIFTGADSLTQYLFENILNKKAKRNRGIIKLTKDNRDIELYIKVLQEYGLIFEKNPFIYVAPQFLPDEPHMERFMSLLPLNYTIKITKYMPRYLITRTIIYFAGLDRKAHYWKNGIMFKLYDVNYLILFDTFEQTISIHSEDKINKFKINKQIFELILNKATFYNSR